MSAAIFEDEESVFTGNDVGTATAPLAGTSAETQQPPAETGQPSGDQPATDQPAEGEQKPSDQTSAEAKPEGEQPPAAEQKRTDWRAETFRTRGELRDAQQQITDLQAQIEAQKAETIGIRADGPAETWAVKDQLMELPEPYFDKLVDTVFKLPNVFDEFARGTLHDPNSDPEAYQVLLAATGAICEQKLGMPFDRIAKVLTATQYLKDDQLDQLAQGRMPDVAPVRGSEELYRLAEQAGIDTNDPVVAGLFNRIDGSFAALASKFNTMEQRLQQYEGQLGQRRAQEEQGFAGEIQGLVDAEVDGIITAEADKELGSRIPAGEDRQALIEFAVPRIQRELARNAKTKDLPEQIKGMAVDTANGKRELSPKVQGQLRAYRVYVNGVAKNIVADLLKRTVVATNGAQIKSDAAKANGQSLVNAASGAVGQGSGLENDPDWIALQNEKPRTIAESGEWAARRDAVRQRYRQQAQR